MEHAERRRPVAAFLLSLVVPGLGHVYCVRFRRGIACFIGLWLTLSILGVLGLLSSFKAMIAFLTVAMAVQLLIAVDAAILAARLKAVPLKRYSRWYCYVATALVVHLALNPALVWLAQSQIVGVRSFKVSSSSMSPVLEPGDHFLVRLRRWSDYHPSRGDVVVFIYPEDKTKLFVFRVIGLPGERIEIKNKQVFVNNRKLDDPWGIHKDTRVVPHRDNTGDTVLVPPRKVFVMGDNRDHSNDSRFWGFVENTDVVGKADFIYWSKERDRIGSRIN